MKKTERFFQMQVAVFLEQVVLYINKKLSKLKNNLFLKAKNKLEQKFCLQFF